jgi:hypothetical protein
MLYVEAWGAEQAFRRLGFSRDDVYYIVADNADRGFVEKNVLHVVLRAQEKEFVYTVGAIDRPMDEARAFIIRFKEALGNSELISEAFGTALYRATQMGAVEGKRFMHLAELLLRKGFVLPALVN